MNVDVDVELDRILGGADFTEGGEADQEPGLSPELVAAVATHTVDAVSAQGIATRQGREGITLKGGAYARRPSHLSPNLSRGTVVPLK